MLGVPRAVEAVTQREGWEQLPRFALGVSSGGAFAMLLALRIPLAGIVVQVCHFPTIVPACCFSVYLFTV